MDEIKVEKIRMEDGRRAERHVKEVDNGKGCIERVVELHVEEERPLYLSQRVVEKTKPAVYERKFETINAATGEIVESRVEAVDSPVKMQSVETLGTVQSMMASQSAPVTQEDLSRAMLDLATALAGREVTAQKVPMSIPQPIISMQSVVAEAIDEKKPSSLMTYATLGIILAEVAALAYLIMG